MNADVVAEPVVQQVEAAQDEVDQQRVAERPLPEGERGLGIGARRHRHAAQHRRAVLDIEVGLVGAPQPPHLGPADVVGDEGHDNCLGLVDRRQRLGAQNDLVETVAAHPAIDHAPPDELLQLRRPCLRVSHFGAEGEGIAHRQNWRAGHRSPGAAPSIGFYGEAVGPIAGARHVTQPVVLRIAARIALGEDGARLEHEVGPGEQIAPEPGPQTQFEHPKAHQDGGHDQQDTPGKLGAGALRVGHIHRSGML